MSRAERPKTSGGAREAPRDPEKERPMKARTLASLVTILALGTACANAPTTGPGSGGIGHSSDPNVPLLTIRYEGGYVAPSTLYDRIPLFALYGDGTVVTQGAQMEIYPGPALPAILAQPLSEEGIQAVLQAALDAHLERDGDYSDLGQMGVADAATTAFTFTLDGATHRVTAYALDIVEQQQPGQSDEMWQMRKGLQHLVNQVSDLASLVPAGSLGDPEPFQGSSAQLLIGPYRAEEDLQQQPVDWPLGTPLGQLGDPTDMLGPDARCAIVGGEEWTQVHDLAADANQLTPWVSGGARYAVSFRPLLPDEPGCTAR
jgi:hypothetical protein